MAMNSCIRCLGEAAGNLNQGEISIIGTGNYGVAIGQRLIQSGFNVTFGSRRPGARNVASINPALQKANVTDIGTAIQQNDVIIFAVRVANFQSLTETYSKVLTRKLVIDVSNKSKDVKLQTSNAEYLQSLLPECSVVKAFNVISAYTMEAGLDDSSRQVPIASDNADAKEVVANLATSLEFTPRDSGALIAARELEESVLRVFPMWKFPILVTLTIFALCWLYVSYLYFIRRTVFSWEQLFFKVLNKPLAMTSVNMFALTYLPSCVAAIMQLYNGTKYKRFPDWMDFWLRSRKQLGLVAFFLAAVHVLISAIVNSPTYYSSWFYKTDVVIPANLTEDLHLKLPVKQWMTWKGEVACLTGVIAFFVFCILAVTSFPSVGQTMNWAEWRFVQSRLGFFGLFMSVAHAYVMGFPAWIRQTSFIPMFRSITFMSTIPAVIAILLKIILCMPGIKDRLRKIRRGWERGQDKISYGEEEAVGFKSRIVIQQKNGSFTIQDEGRNGGKNLNQSSPPTKYSTDGSHYKATPTSNNAQMGDSTRGEGIGEGSAVCINNRKPTSCDKPVEVASFLNQQEAGGLPSGPNAGNNKNGGCCEKKKDGVSDTSYL